MLRVLYSLKVLCLHHHACKCKCELVIEHACKQMIAKLHHSIWSLHWRKDMA